MGATSKGRVVKDHSVTVWTFIVRTDKGFRTEKELNCVDRLTGHHPRLRSGEGSIPELGDVVVGPPVPYCGRPES